MIMDTDKKQRKKKRKSAEAVQKTPTKMEVDNEDSSNEKEEEEEETVKPEVKRVKLDAEISLLDRLHGSDPLSAFRDLDQMMQADQTV